MGIVRDVIPAFELFQPTTVDDVLGLLDRHAPDTWLMAGGMDSFDWLKDRIRRPRVVIDLSGVESMRGIKEANGGLEIGAMTTLTDITANAMIKEQFGLLAKAAEHVASPQIRNIGTLGGNLAQDTRCWYYRQGWPCYRAERQHLLRRYANGDQPRARHLRSGPMRRGHALGHGAGARRARCVDGGAPRWRCGAGDPGERVLRAARLRHHAHDGDGSGRPARGHPHPGDVCRQDRSISRRFASARCGTSGS